MFVFCNAEHKQRKCCEDITKIGWWLGRGWMPNYYIVYFVPTDVKKSRKLLQKIQKTCKRLGVSFFKAPDKTEWFIVYAVYLNRTKIIIFAEN